MNAIRSSLGRPVARSCAPLARLAVVSSCSRAWQSLVATASAIRARSDGSYVAQRTASALAHLTRANEATTARAPARMLVTTLRASEGGDSNAKQDEEDGKHQQNPQQRANEAQVLFFQAEAGIRDLTVAGVQTCALPI